MKLKTATLIASIGTFFMVLSEIYYTFINADGIGKVFGLFYLFGMISLFIFFITLYSKQKEK
ncbi:hypothetical protein [Clostridium estertheticum]|uniref:hypothetical protein n=1 Tax=Clostridium estertheticum TaxID=238834 RepID=UPI001CF0EE83|nr:hypothetical protein [Clostridium estertheticum]MCB2355795.1 hypothetical protein [Clostridium estertheticum]MCB2359229.1 hypothetical protein [Clostridium estertheticum]WAG39381.1 hypothetical protein LL065_13830 [Clostridium estertheticum]